MRPVEQALKKRGVEIIHYTADTEACFQVDLNKELGTNGYLWLSDYQDPEEIEKLYNDHVSYFQRLYASPNGLSLALPQVLDRVIRFTVADWCATRRMLSKVRPTFTLALHELNRWGMILGAFSHVNKIPFFTLQEGLYYGHPSIYRGITKYSHAFIWGRGTEEKLLAAGNAPERLIRVGHPDIASRLSNASTKDARHKLYSELPEAARDKKIVLLFVGNLGISGDISPLFEGLTESPYFLVARSHQLSSVPAIEAMRQQFNKPGSYFSETERADSLAHHWRLMAHAEMFIHIGCSTTVVEWAYTGKPQGQIRTNQMHRDFANEMISVPVDNMTFLNAIKKIDFEWHAHEKATVLPPDFRSWADDQKRFVDTEIDHGDAAGAIAEKMLEMSNGR